MNRRKITIRYGEFCGEMCYEAIIEGQPHIVEYADTWEEAFELAVDTIRSLPLTASECE